MIERFGLCCVSTLRSDIHGGCVFSSVLRAEGSHRRSRLAEAGTDLPAPAMPPSLESDPNKQEWQEKRGKLEQDQAGRGDP